MAESLHESDFIGSDIQNNGSLNGIEECSYKLAKLHDICEQNSAVLHPVQFKEACKRLQKKVKHALGEKESETGRKIYEFSLGSTSVDCGRGARFSAINTATWSVKNDLNRKLTHYKERSFDGLIVIGCIDALLIPRVVKNIHTDMVNQHNYMEGLLQAIEHYFMFYKPDKRFTKSNNISQQNPQLGRGSIIFVVYKFVRDVIKNNGENIGCLEENTDERTDMQKVLQEQIKINREMSRRLELLEARVDNKIGKWSPKSLKTETPDRMSPDEGTKPLNRRKSGKRSSDLIAVDKFEHQKKRRQYSGDSSLQSDSTNDYAPQYQQESHGRQNVHTLDLDCSSEEEPVMIMESSSNDNLTEAIDRNAITMHVPRTEGSDRGMGPLHVTQSGTSKSNYQMSLPAGAIFTGGRDLVFPFLPRYTNETANRVSRKIGPRFSSDEKIMILSCYLNQVPRGDWMGILDSMKSQCEQLSRELREYYMTSDRLSLKRRIQDYVLGVLNDKRGRNEKSSEVRDLIEQIRASTDDSYTITFPPYQQGDMQMIDNNGSESNYGLESNGDGNEYPVICKIEDES